MSIKIRLQVSPRTRNHGTIARGRAFLSHAAIRSEKGDTVMTRKILIAAAAAAMLTASSSFALAQSRNVSSPGLQKDQTQTTEIKKHNKKKHHMSSKARKHFVASKARHKHMASKVRKHHMERFKPTAAPAETTGSASGMTGDFKKPAPRTENMR